MISVGSITLPSGNTISAGQGGCYGIGSDRYPVTIIGWTKSGKTIYYQAARSKATKDACYYTNQRYVFIADPDAEIQVATWRRRDGCFVPKGRQHGYVSTKGYAKYTDPSK